MSNKSGSKNHLSGKILSGSHTTVIDGVSKVIEKFSKEDWFVSVRAGEIITGKKIGGGNHFVSIKKHKNELYKNTLELIFKRSGVIQKIYVQVENLDTNYNNIFDKMSKIISDIWKSAELIKR
jgi:hypothetical protein